MTDSDILLLPLLEGEMVCETCRLAHWEALGFCPNCEFWGPPRG